MVTRVLTGWLAVGFLLAGCSDPLVNPPGSQAQLRLLNGGAVAADLEVAGQPVARGVAPGHASALLVVPGGAQRLVVRLGGDVVSTIDATLSTAHVNSVVVANGTAQLSGVVEPDTGSTAPDRANIRLVVVATDPAPPTDLTALLRRAGSADTTQRFGIDATVARYGTLMYFDPGTFTVRYLAKNTDTPTLAEATFSVANGERRALVLSRTGGVYHVNVVTEQ